MVVTHLALNGTINIRGQLGDMTKCLKDKKPQASDLAKLFFTELSTKDNVIYNTCRTVRQPLLGSYLFLAHSTYTVISHLSSGDHAVDEKAFQSTMHHTFTFIEKVSLWQQKWAENVVDKLCQCF